MTQSAILDKLKAKLTRPPQNEADVVYVLAEIRKYLDHIEPKGGKYVVLRTYCDWAVHTLLDRSGAKSFLRSLNEAYAKKGTALERKKAMRDAFERFSLTHFQKELRQFLEAQNLPLSVVDDCASWGQFLKHYVAVVSDCPFVFSGKPAGSRAITKVTVQIDEATKSAENAIKGMVNVIWRWKLEFADGTQRTISTTYGYPV